MYTHTYALHTRAYVHSYIFASSHEFHFTVSNKSCPVLFLPPLHPSHTLSLSLPPPSLFLFLARAAIALSSNDVLLRSTPCSAVGRFNQPPFLSYILFLIDRLSSKVPFPIRPNVVTISSRAPETRSTRVRSCWKVSEAVARGRRGGRTTVIGGGSGCNRAGMRPHPSV